MNSGFCDDDSEIIYSFVPARGRTSDLSLVDVINEADTQAGIYTSSRYFVDASETRHLYLCPEMHAKYKNRAKKHTEGNNYSKHSENNKSGEQR